jgi:MFS family permease
MTANIQNKKFTPYVIFFLSASFYLYEYILQVAPSVMAEPMMKTFGVSAAGFGIVSACYFYAYAPMQLPAGILFDRYGPRKLMTFALLLCAAGSFFFASTTQIFTAALGRFMIGVGSAFSFIGVLVLVSRWFPARQFAFLAGIAQLMSSIGAIFGEMPLAKLISLVGWRNASFILSACGVLLSWLIWTIIRDYPDARKIEQAKKLTNRKLVEEWQRLKEVCRHSYTWIIGVYAGAIWTPIAVFASLWGVPYLQQKYQIDVLTASGICSLIWLGIGVGSPLLGWLSDYLHSRRIALILSAIMGIFATIGLLYIPDLSIFWICVAAFLLGLGAGGQTVSFAVVTDNNPPELVGTASGFNNLSVLVGAAIFQPIVGLILSRSTDWIMQNDIPVYSVASFNKALMVMPGCFLLSLLIGIFLLKETHPECTMSLRVC